MLPAAGRQALLSVGGERERLAQTSAIKLPAIHAFERTATDSVPAKRLLGRHQDAANMDFPEEL